ncbi:complement C1q-like protein 2 isoform X1 [Procambarus clarkii]|uniref:complement C1q-like protein 2 isoform X1 n=2 Tax=Procambarus clarkii TaxID=6728 RepID=UPI00374274C3
MSLKMAVTLIWMGLVGLLAMGVDSQGKSTVLTPYDETGPLANVSTNATTKRPRDVMGGYLSTRPHVSFSVKMATEKLTAVARLHFQEVLTNTGGGWDTTTSEFLAPIAGGYFFTFNAVGDRTSDFTMSLTKNGVNQASAYGTMPTFEHAGNSVFLELKSLDKISLELQQGSIYEHPGNETYTSFVGFLLYRL